MNTSHTSAYNGGNKKVEFEPDSLPDGGLALSQMRRSLSHLDFRDPVTSSISNSRSTTFFASLRPLAKRAIDIVISGLLLIFCTPLFVIIALIVASDGGRVLHPALRVGRGGREFKCYKFRTMAVDAEDALATLLERDPLARAEWELNRKLAQDPRITRAGRYLRTMSLDELPQLVCVAVGTMSLVGPRPVPAAELNEYYGEHARDYFSVKPGLTGPWQVSGRSDCTYDRRVKLDVAYACNPSLRTDLRILLQTIPAVMSCRGAR